MCKESKENCWMLWNYKAGYWYELLIFVQFILVWQSLKGKNQNIAKLPISEGIWSFVYCFLIILTSLVVWILANHLFLIVRRCHLHNCADQKVFFRLWWTTCGLRKRLTLCPTFSQSGPILGKISQLHNMQTNLSYKIFFFIGDENIFINVFNFFSQKAW